MTPKFQSPLSIKDALELANKLESGELYECGGQVIYGWRVGAYDDPTSDAAEMLVALIDEVENLRQQIAEYMLET